MKNRIGDYQIEETIAEGGMGTVYLARQISLNREVALKVLKHEYGERPTFVKRFLKEAENVASLHHPNIVQIYNIGEEDGIYYFAMEYVDGCDLKHFMRKNKRLQLSQVLDIAIKTADALACAMEKRIIHRDIKPANIMIGRSNRVKVADFGIAKSLSSSTDLTEIGKILGSVDYMSPEQGLGKSLDHRSDIYSLGVVIYEMLAGRQPFKGDHPSAVIYNHIYEPPPPIHYYNKNVPEPVIELVNKMMAKDPFDRPQTATELIIELETLRDEFCPTNGRKSASGTLLEAVPTAAILVERFDHDRKIVLVADDDPDCVLLYRSVLEDLDVNILVARDGMEALELWRKARPDVIVLDLNMPNLGGLAVLEEKDVSKLSGEVIVVSCQSDWSAIKRAGTHHVRNYLMKPFDPFIFRERVENALVEHE